MIDRELLVGYTDTLLGAAALQDYAPNGLQVEGALGIERIVAGVTASIALIEAAIDRKAQLILVHHGYFWRGDNPTVTGARRRRLQLLLQHDINLLAYHLPLDVHPVYGNNVQFARQLDISVTGEIACGGIKGLMLRGELPVAMAPTAFAEHMKHRLARAPLHLAGSRPEIRAVAWCTGGAQGYFEAAIAAGVDAFISGEVSEQTTHLARESGVHYFAAGHHASERYGVGALGAHLAAHFGLAYEFVDIDNPV
jgi:dinuclear metal center YbgI/SA1388 family protein